jgi:hypothetical protein
MMTGVTHTPRHTEDPEPSSRGDVQNIWKLPHDAAHRTFLLWVLTWSLTPFQCSITSILTFSVIGKH